MAKFNKGKKKGNPKVTTKGKVDLGHALPAPASTSFITLKFNNPQGLQQLQSIGTTKSQNDLIARAELNEKEVKKSGYALPPRPEPNAEPPISSINPHAAPINTSNNPTSDPAQPPDMRLRGNWPKNKANPELQHALKTKTSSDEHASVSPPSPINKAKSGTANRKRKGDLSSSDDTGDQIRDALNPKSKKNRRLDTRSSVSFAPDVISTPTPTYSPSSSDSATIDRQSSDKENHYAMEAPAKPKMALNLKLSMPKNAQTPASSSPPAATPGATPTPSIKLKFGSIKGKDAKDGSAKKRKREQDDIGRSMATPLSATAPKIKLKTSVQPAPSPITPAIKLGTRGKIQKRKPGVGYDSELSDTERDPVILEGIILRMQPGPDCDYLRDAIAKGTIGVSKLQGGADVYVRALDTEGRRGMIIIRKKPYATTLVDLPCIVEGMKSWDNKRFVKSIDVSQMLLVLGPVKNEEEAKTYPLPEGVDPKSYRYAHGLTAPMQWVRKRRFERTRRTPAWELEAIARRVSHLIQGDAGFDDVKYEVLDYDPRVGEDQYSSEAHSSEGYDDTDAAGEDEDDGYFPSNAAGQYGNGDDEEDVQVENEEDFLAMFGGSDDEGDTTMANNSSSATAAHRPNTNGHHVHNIDSSTAADSPQATGSGAPTSTAAPTPAAEEAASTPADTTGADAESDEDDDGADADDQGEEQNEQDEQKAATRERIQTLQNKIDDETKTLKGTANHIIRRRLAQKIQGMQNDVKMLRKELGEDGEDGEGAAENGEGQDGREGGF